MTWIGPVLTDRNKSEAEVFKLQGKFDDSLIQLCAAPKIYVKNHRGFWDRQNFGTRCEHGLQGRLLIFQEDRWRREILLVQEMYGAETGNGNDIEKAAQRTKAAFNNIYALVQLSKIAAHLQDPVYFPKEEYIFLKKAESEGLSLTNNRKQDE